MPTIIENEEGRRLVDVLKRHGYEKIARQSAITGSHLYAHPQHGHEVAVNPKTMNWNFRSKMGYTTAQGSDADKLDGILSQGLMR